MKTTLISLLIATVTGLSLTERNEISRRFKYYYNSVRPTAFENLMSNVNGTFFKIGIEFHLVGTQIKTRSLMVDAVVMYRWTDDRLALRDLFDDFELPKEFEPWLPRVRTIPEPHTVTIVLSPATGVISLYHRVKEFAFCSATEWKHPFESFDCELETENVGDELLIVNKLRDLRPEQQIRLVEAELAPFPSSSLHMKFSADWNSALLSVYLPSLLIVTIVFFAQWKRRKVQILVSLAAIMCILVLLVSSRPYNSATLLDLWISGCFIHAVFLLLVDLTLPARRVRYALLVDVQDHEKRPRQTVLECRSPQSKVDLIKDWVQRRLGIKRERNSTTQLVPLPTESGVMQRQITTTTLGERKKIALVVVGLEAVSISGSFILLRNLRSKYVHASSFAVYQCSSAVELSCKHQFCVQCLGQYTGTLCPALLCAGTRSSDIIVDEMAGVEGSAATQIAFGSYTLSVLDLEERQRCEARHGAFPCVNVARMYLINCRHRICYDCLTEKLSHDILNNDIPNCPLARCSNRISKIDVRTLANRSPKDRELCETAEQLITEKQSEMPPDKEEIVVESYIYGREATNKRIIIPKLCVVSDLINAILQMQRLARNRTTSSISIFVRFEMEKGLYKYEKLVAKELGKKTVKDLNWADTTYVVVDIDNQLHRHK